MYGMESQELLRFGAGLGTFVTGKRSEEFD